MGGSGKYSAASTDPWLDMALDSLRLVHASQVPAFASCWGFQGMAAAMGGEVVHDRGRAEVGTHELVLTSAGRADPVLGATRQSLPRPGRPRGPRRNPPASNHPARLFGEGRQSGLPLRGRADLLHAVPPRTRRRRPARALSHLPQGTPAYIAGTTLEELLESLEDTPDTEELIRRFVETHVRR